MAEGERKRFEVVTPFDPTDCMFDTDPSAAQRALNDAAFTLAKDLADQRDAFIATLPAGHRFCVHTGVQFAVEDDFEYDGVRLRARQRGHTLAPGETCDWQGGERTEYGPMPATIVINDVIPNRRLVTVDPEDLEPFQNHIAAWHKANTDHIVDQFFDAIRPPGEAPALGIVTSAPAAPEPEDPTSLHGRLRKVFDAFGANTYRPDPLPIVSPETIARHQAAAELPRAPWIAVRNPFPDKPGEWYWIAAKPTWGLNPRPVDPWGSSIGRSLFRTGQFIARPDGRDGWDVAEIMVTS